jgi:hypothetical protein
MAGKTDENNEYVSLATSDDVNENPQELRVDPVTGRLLVELHCLPEVERTLNSQKIDENNETVAEAVDDDGEIKPLLIDSRNGHLLIDLDVE